jgi:hypothetical protein
MVQHVTDRELTFAEPELAVGHLWWGDCYIGAAVMPLMHVQPGTFRIRTRAWADEVGDLQRMSPALVAAK